MPTHCFLTSLVLHVEHALPPLQPPPPPLLLQFLPLLHRDLAKVPGRQASTSEVSKSTVCWGLASAHKTSSSRSQATHSSTARPIYLWAWSEIVVHQLEANARPRSLSPFSCVFCASCQHQPVASGLSFARSMTWPTVCQRPHANTLIPNKSRASCLSTPCLLCSLRLLLCCSFCRFFIATWPRCQEDTRQHLKCQKALCVGGSRPLIKQHIPALAHVLMVLE